LAEPLLLRAGDVWTGKAFERLDVFLKAGLIESVGPKAGPADVKVLDCTGFLIIPGLVNAHTHSHNIIGRGLLDRISLELLVAALPAVVAGRSVEESYVAAALNAIEMVKTGCTACCDQFLSHPGPITEHAEAIAQAYSDVGIRANLAPSLSDVSIEQSLPGLADLVPPSADAPLVDLDTVKAIVDRIHGSGQGLITAGLAPSIPVACTDSLLQACVDLAETRGLLLFTHLGESDIHSLAHIKVHGESETRRLQRLGFLSPRSVLAHSIYLSEADVKLLGDARVVVAHAPASNLRLGNGIAPIARLRRAGVTVSIGTDGALSSDNQNMFEAMRFAALVSRVRDRREQNWMSSLEAFRIATQSSPTVLGIRGLFGAVAEGYAADLVLLRQSSTYLHPQNSPITQLVLAETGSSVHTVIVDGRVVLRDGRVLGLDEAVISSAADEAARRMKRENGQLWRDLRTTAVGIGRLSRSLRKEMAGAAEARWI
jgi:guanine deaminase